jgi:SdrD B-like protein
MLSQNRRTQERAARHVAPIVTCALALAAVVAFARPAAAQGEQCGGEGVVLCGTVWSDLNGNGIQDAGEPGIGGIPVLVYDGTTIYETTTDSNGNYFFDSQTLVPNPSVTYSVSIETAAIGTGVQPSPTDSPLGNDGNDSDGVDDTTGRSIFYPFVISDAFTVHDVDFGFAPSGAKNPGTGTPGYWKNHPNAWPVSSITIGGVLYSRDEAIAILTKPGKDKRATMFSSLLSATLNVMIGNDPSCVQTTIDAANDWMATWGIPNQGTIVAGGSAAWAVGEPLHKQMDAYNNGLLCAPHRN